ncbi:MAG: GGDEF domain-containing protein, partial [Nitrospirota bacterium]
MAGWEFSTTAISPFVAVTWLCLISFLILGVLWLKQRYSTPESYPERSMEQLSELSPTYDYVTGLPTRRLFGTLLEQAVERATKTGRFLAL